MQIFRNITLNLSKSKNDASKYIEYPDFFYILHTIFLLAEKFASSYTGGTCYWWRGIKDRKVLLQMIKVILAHNSLAYLHSFVRALMIQSLTHPFWTIFKHFIHSEIFWPNDGQKMSKRWYSDQIFHWLNPQRNLATNKGQRPFKSRHMASNEGHRLVFTMQCSIIFFDFI